eukprot:6185125-Pleurochrysis_carterae.AAC.1
MRERSVLAWLPSRGGRDRDAQARDSQRRRMPQKQESVRRTSLPKSRHDAIVPSEIFKEGMRTTKNARKAAVYSKMKVYAENYAYNIRNLLLCRHVYRVRRI